MDDFQGVKPTHVRHFFHKLCVVAARYSMRQKAALQLSDHINKLKKHSSKKEYHQDLSLLQNKIKDYVQMQKKIKLQIPKEGILDQSLQQRMQDLEEELASVRKEKDSLTKNNKEKIDILAGALSSLKHQIEFLSRKEKERMHKKQFLEKRIDDKMK